jgi:hypothetical protein
MRSHRFGCGGKLHGGTVAATGAPSHRKPAARAGSAIRAAGGGTRESDTAPGARGVVGEREMR